MGDMRMGKYREVLVFSGETPQYQDLSNHHRGQDYRRGHVRQMFAVHDPEAGISYRASYSTTPPGPSSPRHRHNFEQIRFILEGEWMYGKNRRFGPGMLGFFAEGVFYGPQQNLKESRGFVIQYPGPTNAKFIPREDEKRLQKEMVEKGCKFESGLCTWPDGKRQDGSEAMWEYAAGERIKYPKPRYEDQVWLDTNEFQWKPSGVPGVSIKRLAYFSERGPCIALLKLDPGAATPGGETGCMMMRYVYEGEAEYAGQRLPCVSSLYYPPDAPYQPLKSGPGCTVLSIELQLAGESAPLPYRV